MVIRLQVLLKRGGLLNYETNGCMALFGMLNKNPPNYRGTLLMFSFCITFSENQVLLQPGAGC